MTVNPITPEVQDLAQWLYDQDAAAGTPLKAMSPGVCQICNKLRAPLSSLAGIAGYKSLLSRALTLAKAEDHGLDAYQVNAEGYIELREGADPQRDIDETRNGGIILVAHLLGLLMVFIGKNLTLDLVRGVWPDAP